MDIIPRAEEAAARAVRSALAKNMVEDGWEGKTGKDCE